MGDSDPALARYREPDEKHDLGLWFLYHCDLRNTKRVAVFWAHMQQEIKNIERLFVGT
jgi:hypothetical protein